jgi:hypothetical protein
LVRKESLGGRWLSAVAELKIGKPKGRKRSLGKYARDVANKQTAVCRSSVGRLWAVAFKQSSLALKVRSMHPGASICIEMHLENFFECAQVRVFSRLGDFARLSAGQPPLSAPGAHAERVRGRGQRAFRNLGGLGGGHDVRFGLLSEMSK